MEKSELDPNQSRQTFPLGRNQRHFLLTGKKGSSSSKSSVGKSVKSKLNEIGPRIQDLIDDIVLLNRSGYIDQEQEKVWKQLTHIESRESWMDESVLLSDQFQDPFNSYRRCDSEQDPDPDSEERFEHVQLGFAFGQALRAMYNTAPETRYEDLLWGVVVGVIGQPFNRRSQEQELFDSLLFIFEILAENRRKQPPEDQVYRSTWAERNQRVNAGEESDIVLPASLRTSIIRSDLPFTVPLWIEVDQVIKNGGVSREYMDSLKELLFLCENLREMLLHDIDRLEEKKRRGSDAKPIFREIWTSDISQSSSTVAGDLLGDAKTQIGKILNDLSGAGKSGGGWQYQPLVERNNGKFSTTEYGDLLGYCLFHVYNIRAWMHSSLFDRNISYQSSSSPFESSEEFFDMATTPDSPLDLMSIGIDQLE